MALLNKYILLGLIILGGPSAFADEHDIVMEKGTLLEVKSYDKKFAVFEIVEDGKSGQGPWFAKPEELVKAVPSLNLSRLKGNPNSIISNQYTADKPLKLMAEDQLGANPAPAKTKK